MSQEDNIGHLNSCLDYMLENLEAVNDIEEENGYMSDQSLSMDSIEDSFCDPDEEGDHDLRSHWKKSRSTFKYNPITVISNPKVEREMANCYSLGLDKRALNQGPYPRMVHIKCLRSDCNNKGIILNPYFDDIHFHTTLCTKQNCNHDNESCVIVASISQCK